MALMDVIIKHRDGILNISKQYPVSNIRVFGSVIKGEDKAQSDIDFLVDYDPGLTLIQLCDFQHRLAELLGTRVDVVSPNEFPEDLRLRILKEAKKI